jgi:hypothetical protein
VRDVRGVPWVRGEDPDLVHDLETRSVDSHADQIHDLLLKVVHARIRMAPREG